MDQYYKNYTEVWRYFDGTAKQALAWTVDIDLVVVLRAAKLSGIDHTDVSPHLHFGGFTDDNTIQLGAGDTGVAGSTATKIVSTGGGAFIDLGTSSGNVAETAGGDTIYDANSYADAQSGNQLIHLTSKDASQDTTVIFGMGGGHTVLKSDIGLDPSGNSAPNAPDPFNAIAYVPGSTVQTSSSGTYKGLNNLHIVLDGLIASDVTFYYKQVGEALYSSGPRSPTGIATVAGYIKINSTGETLTLPDADQNTERGQAGALPIQYFLNYGAPESDVGKTYALKVPDTFSITFGDGTVLMGKDAAALFTQKEDNEFLSAQVPHDDGKGIAILYGPAHNAPDEDTQALQNTGGGGGPTMVSDTSGAASLSGTTGNDVIDSLGTATTVSGMGGNDTYAYKQGYAAFTVNNFDSANNGNEGTVQFGAGISATSLTFASTGAGNADLQVSVPGTASSPAASSVTVAGAFTADGLGRIKQLAFADGSTLAFAALQSALPAGTAGTATLAGTTQNFFGHKEQDSFVRSSANTVQVTGTDTTGAVQFAKTLSGKGGAVFTLDAGTSVIGAGVNFLPAFSAGPASTYGDTAFLRSGTGALSAVQFDGNGTLVATQALSYNGNPLIVDATTTVVGAGQDYYGNGGHTLFLRENGGLTVINEFDNTGSFTSGQALTYNGARLSIDGTAAVVGAGQDFFGIGERTILPARRHEPHRLGLRCERCVERRAGAVEQGVRRGCERRRRRGRLPGQRATDGVRLQRREHGQPVGRPVRHHGRTQADAGARHERPGRHGIQQHRRGCRDDNRGRRRGLLRHGRTCRVPAQRWRAERCRV